METSVNFNFFTTASFNKQKGVHDLFPAKNNALILFNSSLGVII
jgi:hypothetical protein